MNRKEIIEGGPFRELDHILKKARIRVTRQESPPPKPAPKPPPEPPPVILQAASDEELFERAMEGVIPVNRSRERVPSSLPFMPAPSNPELEDLRLMEAALDGLPATSVSDHPEYIEGWVGVSGKLFIPNLRNGLYSIQGQIDLHGFTRGEAQKAVEEFIQQMSRFHSCCVKIIHGRGINSRTDNAVLKESLPRWLTSKRMSRSVVAYASAPMNDGGVGAVYVLLRKRRTHHGDTGREKGSESPKGAE